LAARTFHLASLHSLAAVRTLLIKMATTDEGL
jgi:hypothetical protein